MGYRISVLFWTRWVQTLAMEPILQLLEQQLDLRTQQWHKVDIVPFH